MLFPYYIGVLEGLQGVGLATGELPCHTMTQEVDKASMKIRYTFCVLPKTAYFLEPSTVIDVK